MIQSENNENEIKDNGILLISEVQNKVILPYTCSEVEDIFVNGEYENKESVIQDKFVRTYDEYKDMYFSRARETYKLLIEKEGYSKKKATELAVELFAKKYLHPAIISACKNLNELNVYLDCLDKNELDDFKIFQIKYEVYPVAVGENKLFIRMSLFKKILEFIKNFFRRENNKTEENQLMDK